ncbi:MAG: NAD-binding protein [Anaerovoracaceae bacterium]
MKIAIVGAGKLGLKVADALLGGDHSVTVIDKNIETLQKLASQMDIMTVNGNAKEISMLKNIHISSFDFLLAVTDSDEKNIVIASFAKKLGCAKVIARVRDPEHMHQFDFIRESMSIDAIVNPDMAITLEIYKYLVEKYTLSNGIFTRALKLYQYLFKC